jgi:hypothetical protein
MPLGSHIIICNGRIVLQASRITSERIKAASQTATDLISYYGDSLTEAYTAPISNLQHAMMDAMSSGQARKSEEMVDEMFVLLDQLEDRMSS